MVDKQEVRNMPKTIAQYFIQRWLEANFYTSHLKVEYTDGHEAKITDQNGDTACVVYEEGEIFLKEA